MFVKLTFVEVKKLEKSCHILLGEPENKKKCKGAIYLLMKVQVLHLNSGRKAKQTWAFCETHASQFLARKGEGWFSYRYRDGERAPVVDYELLAPELLEE